MNDFLTSISDLTATLAPANHLDGSVEGQSLGLLNSLLDAIDRRHHRDLEYHVSLLKQFWLESIPWCSELSKRIEKILILYDEQNSGGGCRRQR